jgi:hypothetical protein
MAASAHRLWVAAILENLSSSPSQGSVGLHKPYTRSYPGYFAFLRPPGALGAERVNPAPGAESLAKYRWLPAEDVVLILAVRHQREAGYTEE